MSICDLKFSFLRTTIYNLMPEIDIKIEQSYLKNLTLCQKIQNDLNHKNKAKSIYLQTKSTLKAKVPCMLLILY